MSGTVLGTKYKGGDGQYSLAHAVCTGKNPGRDITNWFHSVTTMPISIQEAISVPLGGKNKECAVRKINGNLRTNKAKLIYL